MNLHGFKDSLAKETPPLAVSCALQALWQDAKGNWDKAHALAQSQHDSAGAWVHAYLHRKEGNTSNAAYWYRRAGQVMPQVSLEDEWEQIASALLEEQTP